MNEDKFDKYWRWGTRFAALYFVGYLVFWGAVIYTIVKLANHYA